MGLSSCRYNTIRHVKRYMEGRVILTGGDSVATSFAGFDTYGLFPLRIPEKQGCYKQFVSLKVDVVGGMLCSFGKGLFSLCSLASYNPVLKNHLKGTHFGTVENIQTAETDQLKATPVSEFDHCYEEWKKRLQRCVASEVSYFEAKYVMPGGTMGSCDYKLYETKPTGLLYSPKYPSSYPRNTRCTYTISARDFVRVCKFSTLWVFTICVFWVKLINFMKEINIYPLQTAPLILLKQELTFPPECEGSTGSPR
uniref:CUB domain-containing protein n=1 Tax=Rhodnius prolixus TaxID=13249 RepID=T1I829_RHOPR